MNFLDIRTVLFSTIISGFICMVVMLSLWLQSRRLSPEFGFWLADFVMQFVAILLIASRGVLPDFISVVVGNALVIGGLLLLYIGLERYAGKTSRQWPNYVFLAAFILAHAYFAFGQPSLLARTINFSLGLMVVCTQCVWLLLRRVDSAMRPATRLAGLIFAAYSLVSLIRIFVNLTVPRENDFFKLGLYDVLVLLIYQMLFICLTFALVLMVNRRLFTGLESDITERKQAEEALRVSETRFRMLFQNEPMSGVIYRLIRDAQNEIVDWEIQDINGLGAADLSQTPSELIGKRAIELFGAEVMKPYLETCRSVVASNQPQHFETHFAHNGKYYLTGVFTIDSEHYANVSVDITERKQAELKIQELEEFNRATLDALSAQICVLDENGVIVSVNRAWHEFAEVNPPTLKGHFLGTNYLTICDGTQGPNADESAAVAHGIRAVINGDLERFQLEYPCHSPWAERWFAVEVTRFVGNGPLRIVVAHKSITERIQAEELLHQRERQMQSLVNSLEDIFFEFNEQGTYLNIWTANESLLFQPRAEILGKRVTEVLGEEFAAPFVEAFKRVLADGKSEDIEYPLKVISGQRWFMARISPVPAPDGTARTVSMLVRDITERKQTETALQESEARFREVLENSLGASYKRDLQTNAYDYLSPVFVSISGYTSEEMKTLPVETVLGLIHPEDVPEVTRVMAEAISKPTDSSHQVDYRFKHKADGKYHWLHDQFIIMRDVQGQAVALIGSVSDITKRKLAELALHVSEEKYRFLVENMTDVVWQITPDLHFTYSSPTDEKQRGYKPEEVLGRSIFDFMTPESKSKVLELSNPRQTVIQQGRKLTDLVYEIEQIRKDGALIWTEVSSHPVYDAAGHLLHFHGITRDITERKLADKALRASEEKFRAIIETSPDAIGLFGPGGVALMMNPAAAVTFGYETSTEMIGKNALEFFQPEDQQRAADMIQQVLASGAVRNVEFDLLRKNGKWFSAEFSCSALYEADGKPRGIVAVTRDITERKRAEAALRDSNEVAQAILNSANEAIFLMELNGKLLAANEMIAVMLGKSVTDLIGTNMYDDLPADVAATRKEYVAAVTREHQPVIFEDEQFGHWYENRIYPVTDSDGQIRRVAVYGRDITERKQMEDALRESNEIAQAIINSATDGIFLMEINGKILAANEMVAARFGQSVPNLIGTNIFDHIPAEMAAVRKEHIAVVVREHQPVSFEDEQFGRWQENSIYPVADSNGQVRRVAVYWSDVTERKRGEAALRASEEKYRSLMEASDALIFTLDKDGRIEYVNDKAAQYQGMKASDAIGKNLRDILPAGTAERYLQLAQKVISSNAGMVIETTPGKLWYRTSILPVHDENGKAVMVLISSFDITELKTAQNDLMELNRTLEKRVQERSAEVQALYNNAPAGYHSLDEHGMFVMINGTELNWLGYTREEVIGVKSLRDVLTAESQQIFGKHFPLFMEQGWIKDVEIEMVRKDGSVLPVLLNASAVYDDNGKFIQSRATMFDITERRKAEIALRESRNELSAANIALEKAARLKDEFLASMSHELRTPLTGILGLSESLRLNVYGELTGKQQKTIKIIEESGHHLLGLINDILDLSKIEAGKLELQIAPCSLADICQASLQLTKGMAQQKHLRVGYSPLTQPVLFWADARRVKQILVNLLSNAVKFTPENGELGLDVQADEARQTISLTVWDKGIGIKPEDLHKLFQPFTQIDSSLAREYAGTGLGLSLVQRLVELHHGSVEVESVFGEGSRFIVTLLWQRKDTAPVHDRRTLNGQSDSVPVDEKSASLLVMIVDDNEQLLDMLADFLESKQYRTIKIRSGKKLLERAAEVQPDIMLVDIQMPGMDGLETIRRVRANIDLQIAATPIIAVTALTMPGDRERCLAAGANEYLSKPVKLTELAKIIQKETEKNNERTHPYHSHH